MTGVLIKKKKGNLDTEKEDDMKKQGKDHLQAKECLKPPEARREA